MRQVFLERDAIIVKEISRPLLEEHSILVEVHYSCISSGTEVATIANAAKQGLVFTDVSLKIKKVLESVAKNGIDGTVALVKGKLQGELQALGYSCSGMVLAAGKKVKNFRPGDLVACAGAGFASHADIVCIPENLAVRITNQNFLKPACITTLGAIALQGVRRAQLQLGETVCVVGLGLLGQITVQLAKIAGCKVIGIDLVPERLAMARQLGADAVYHATEHDVQKSVAFFTNHYGADATIITASAKNNVVLQQAMEITRKKGRVVIVGDIGLGLERTPLYEKEIDVLISCSYGPGRYDPQYEKYNQDYPFAFVRWTENRNMQAFLELIETGRIAVDTLITHYTTLDEVAHAYENIKNKQILGVIINYEFLEKEIPSQKTLPQTEKPRPSSLPKFIPAVQDSLRVGIIGAGGFAKVKLLPIIAGIRHTKINAIVDANASNAINVARQYNAMKSFVDDEALFQDDLVDVVVISSPHKYHCDQALRALAKGKAVFMEKPMVTDFEQFSRLKEFLSHNPMIPFCVDYNRSFAPFIGKIKQEVIRRSSPLIIHYRMNAGFIPKEHWIQTDVGAGRIIGEACHIFDLFCFLTESKPVSVSVEALHAKQDTLFPTDNFSAQIGFADGSICTLLYTALGHAQLGKERMELFYDSKSIVMDDYEYLIGHGLPKSFEQHASPADKGHASLLNLFFQQLRQSVFKPPIPLERLYNVAAITLVIDQLACEGGGTRDIKTS